MIILMKLCACLPFYIYLLAGISIIAYKLLDLHIEYKSNVKKLDKEEIELKEQLDSEFKKKSIAVAVIISILTIAFTILSYMGASL